VRGRWAERFEPIALSRFLIHFDPEEDMFEGLFQPMHLLVIFGIALLVFGPKKLPELGKGLGDGIRGFKAAMKEQENQFMASKTDETAKN
jgi:sec-independent protein translocase protein TatA